MGCSRQKKRYEDLRSHDDSKAAPKITRLE